MNPPNEAWKALILQSLKTGSDADKLAFYENNLVWHPEPGIAVQPFYTPADLTGLEYLHTFHQTWTATRQTTGWMNVEKIHITHENETQIANQTAHHALQHGADGIWFDIMYLNLEISVLLEGILLTQTPVYFTIRNQGSHHPDYHGLVTPLLQYLAQAYPDRSGLMGGAEFYYEWEGSEVEKIQFFEFVSFFKNSPYFKPLLNSTLAYLGEEEGNFEPVISKFDYLLSNVLEQVDLLTEMGMTVQEVLPMVGFSVETGNSYFLEIAGLRALRFLWWQIAKLYDPALNLIDVFIQAQTVAPEPPETEPYQNLISNTTQAMAALIGGCDALTVMPHDSPPFHHQSTDFSRRIARNVSVLLKEESYFDTLTDPASGAYLIENLTHQLIQAAWAKLGRN